MDLKEYIASGVTELYVMGALPPDERTVFEQKILLYPELREELIKVQSAFEKLASTNERNPRPSLRAEIIEKTKTVAALKKETRQELPSRNSHSLTYKYLIAASLAALVISTFASWFFYSRWNDAEDHNIAMIQENTQLTQNFDVIKNSFDKTYGDLMMMRDENAKVFMLMPIDSTKKYQARVYWNKYTRKSFIDVLSMPEPVAGKQYQLWALVNGQAVDAGMFSTGLEEGMQKMKDIVTAQSWAVTLEPMGGSATPSMDQLYLKSVGS